MEDRCLHGLGDVGGVEAGSGVGGGGREPDLVVDDDVHRAAGVVALELGEVQRLGDHALAGEGGVAVDQHREDHVVGALASGVLLGAGDAHEHGIDRLEVAGVGSDLDGDLAAVGRAVDPAGPEVILDVS